MLPRLFSRRGPVRVQPFFGFRNQSRLYLNARAIRAPEPKFEKSTFWRGLATMVGQYASHEVPGLTVELEYRCGDGTVSCGKAVSGPEGFLRFDLDIAQGCDRFERTRWERADIRWTCPDDPGATRTASAWILTPGEQTCIGIISDIDDTILETGITGNLRAIARNWKRVMAEMPSERVVVPGASDFYAAIGGNPDTPPDAVSQPASNREGHGGGTIAPRARVRPVFYVSSSPWNLFSYLVAFKRHRGLPLGPVMLRDWGFNRKTLGKEGHGSHKRTAIENIFKTFPALRFALIGDDSQKDLVAFGEIATAQPDRIAAVFIRSVSGEPLSAEELAARDAIEAADVPFWTGDDYAAAEMFLESNGLDFEGGVEKLVRTASEGDRAPKPSAVSG